MKKHWVIEKHNPKLKEKLVKALGISSITAQVLINRGIKDEAEAELFLKSTLFDLPSPYLMRGMDKAVERIERAIQGKEKIAIYGDYDVDGVTATSLFYTLLKNLGVNVTYYNRDRLKEGYGVNLQAIKKLKNDGVSLIISGDCGITAWKEVQDAKKLDVDFIVTDHHEPPETIPEAVSVLNPHQIGCSYPGKEIAGVGVIYNLAIALRRALRESGFFRKARPEPASSSGETAHDRNEPNLGDFLDLVALGTVADCASLTNVNRILVKEGMKRMLSPKRPGMIALKEVSGIEGEVNSYDIGFKLGPRINATGRLQSAGVAVELLISQDLKQARELAKILNQENSKRQNIEEDIFLDTVSQIESNPEFLKSNSLVLSSPNWHAGVIGIVATKLVERYQKPAILISIQESGVGKGSGRSIEGINIYAALSECKELFEQFGGHQLAAGISIKEERIDEFRKRFERAISESAGDFVSMIKIDDVVDLNEITDEVVSELELLAPFGIGNPEPVLLSKSLEVISERLFKEKHLSLKLKQKDRVFDAVWFNLKEPIKVPNRIDMAFTPEFNVWNGKKEVRLRIKDIDY
ncbi:MAG TPA: single-stranded-DNA-specific exonuclease RecJ [Thermodesulfobacteriota bacterium]|nr:single-stranded-DNA-specific exonuclease RecJ [Thermodesulfobacteriota bacterium]